MLSAGVGNSLASFEDAANFVVVVLVLDTPLPVLGSIRVGVTAIVVVVLLIVGIILTSTRIGLSYGSVDGVG